MTLLSSSIAASPGSREPSEMPASLYWSSSLGTGANRRFGLMIGNAAALVIGAQPHTVRGVDSNLLAQQAYQTVGAMRKNETMHIQIVLDHELRGVENSQGIIADLRQQLLSAIDIDRPARIANLNALRSPSVCSAACSAAAIACTTPFSKRRHVLNIVLRYSTLSTGSGCRSLADKRLSSKAGSMAIAVWKQHNSTRRTSRHWPVRRPQSELSDPSRRSAPFWPTAAGASRRACYSHRVD